MKDKKQIIEELIDVQIGYYNDREEIRKYLEKQPVVLAMLESYTERINRITDIIIEYILEIPNEPRSNKYNKDNWERGVISSIIEYTIENKGKYKNSTIDLISDWENLNDSTDKVIGENWFYFEELLEEHSKGFPTYHKKVEEEKKKRTKKTTA
ncbi:hypothetical protein [Priestia megaterium]|uniref:hypothetical protein n=1 Tax=Priestia megaterium TaxID=1404 RepID=UPI000CA17E9E|nr:hypothetical protein [Priestia megaterium]AUO12324.1 hypothetical protein C0569_13890 [Priestia megaterium]